MILSCEHCDTSFKVPDSAIGTSGRFVKCSQCGYKWFATPTEVLTLDQEVSEPIEEQPIADSTTAQTEKSFDQPNVQPIVQLDEQPEVQPQEDVVPKSIDNFEQHEQQRYKKFANVKRYYEAPKIIIPFYQRNSFFYGSLTATLAAILILTFTAMVIFKNRIDHYFPSTESFYQSFGLYHNKDLVFASIDCKASKIDSSSKYANNTQELEIVIAIQNLGQTPQKLNNLRISVFNDKMKNLADLIIEKDVLIRPTKKPLIIDGRLNRIPLEAKFVSVEIGNSLDFYFHNPEGLKKFILKKSKPS